jgi:hypothetical protein
MLRQIQADKIDQEMGNDERFDIAVFDIINTEDNPDQKSEYQFAQAIIFVMKCRE